jgi:ribonuclease III
MEVDLNRLEDRLSYAFSDKRLLLESLYHTSYVNERPDQEGLKDNQRLEFLGDAVLNLAMGHLLIERFPEFKEGDLSKMRSGLVSESRLAECARSLELGVYLLIGKGEEKNNGREKSSILADAFEALIAAVYLDGGFNAAFRLIHNLFLPYIRGPALPFLATDAKSRLQEIVQQNREMVPVYTVLQESGPDHDKIFRIQVEVLGITAQGTGKNKKAAEQDAAQNALTRIDAGFSECSKDQ